MGFINNFFKRPVPILRPEDNEELLEIQRKSYMEEARKIIELRGKELARKELSIKKENDQWQRQTS